MSKSFVACFLPLLSPKVYVIFRPRQNEIGARASVRKDRCKEHWRLPRGGPGGDPRAGPPQENNQGVFQRIKIVCFCLRGAGFPGDCGAQCG